MSLNPKTFFCPSLPSLPTANHHIFLLICGYASLLVYSFVCCIFKISHTSDNIQCLCFSVWHFIKHNTLKSLFMLQMTKLCYFCCCSFSVLSESLRPHRLQLMRRSLTSLSPGSCTNSCPLSWWCHPTNSSSVAPFSSCPQSFPASRSFQMNQLFTSGAQSTGASASASVLPGWFPLGLIGLISLCPRNARVFFSTTVQKHKFFNPQPSLWFNSHIYTWLLQKT